MWLALSLKAHRMYHLLEYQSLLGLNQYLLVMQTCTPVPVQTHAYRGACH